MDYSIQLSKLLLRTNTRKKNHLNEISAALKNIQHIGSIYILHGIV